jgi:hypothetical protein
MRLLSTIVPGIHLKYSKIKVKLVRRDLTFKIEEL